MRFKGYWMLFTLALALVLPAAAQTTSQPEKQKQDQMAMPERPYSNTGVSRVYLLQVHAGEMDWFMNDIATNFKPVWEEEKQKGVITGYSVATNFNHLAENNWDVAIVIHFKNFAALDDETTGRAIALKHYGTAQAMEKSWQERFKRLDLVQSLTLQDVTFK